MERQERAAFYTAVFLSIVSIRISSHPFQTGIIGWFLHAHFLLGSAYFIQLDHWNDIIYGKLQKFILPYLCHGIWAAFSLLILGSVPCAPKSNHWYPDPLDIGQSG